MLKINEEIETEWAAGLGPLAHPLLIELQQLLCDFGSVESQSQAMDVELWDDIFQCVLQGQAPPCPMLGGCRCGIL